MLVILKIPVVYLCAVVWWAIKAEPRPLEGAGQVSRLQPRPRGPGRPATGADAAAAAPYRPLPRGGRSRRQPRRLARGPVSADPRPRRESPQHGRPGGRRRA